MKIVYWSLFVILLVISFHPTGSFSFRFENIFNVLNYGAIASLQTDNSKAFLHAWNAACNIAGGPDPTVVVPPNMAFLASSTTFNGPCRAKNIYFRIFGTIVAPKSPLAWKGKDSSQWLVFNGVIGLHIDGLGTLNGQGDAWWAQSCRYHPGPGCTSLAPTALMLISCSNSSLNDIYLTHSPQTHVTIIESDGININNLRIESPESSPNTDGIHIQFSNHLSIDSCTISTGDDCISIGDYTSNIDISHINCGPGHGISIGSLGKSGNVVQVKNIHVSASNLIGTTNGARIKTWQVGKGYVRNVTFENIYFQAVKNPIIIDQNYCEKQGACRERDTGVHISDVVYTGMIGTSSSDIAINLNCSQAVPCSGITLTGIQLLPAIAGREVTVGCSNAHGQEIGVVVPGHCLINGDPTFIK